jgi:acyl carrier protein
MIRSADEIRAWLVARVSSMTGRAPEEIDPGEPFAHYRLDSLAVVSLLDDLEAWLGCCFRVNPLDEHRTIASLARFLAGPAAGADRPE